MTDSVFAHAIFEEARGLLRPVSNHFAVSNYFAILIDVRKAAILTFWRTPSSALPTQFVVVILFLCNTVECRPIVAWFEGYCLPQRVILLEASSGSYCGQLGRWNQVWGHSRSDGVNNFRILDLFFYIWIFHVGFIFHPIAGYFGHKL
jgi:hypothetical protein